MTEAGVEPPVDPAVEPSAESVAAEPPVGIVAAEPGPFDAATLGLGGALLGRGEMVDVLRHAGLGDAEIAEAASHRHLELLAVEHLILPEPAHHDLHDVVAATGLTEHQVVQLWRSLGFAEPQAGDRIFTETDLAMLGTVGHLLVSGWLDEDLSVQMARVIGSSLSRIATTFVESIDPADPSLDPNHEDEFAAVAPVLLPTLSQILDFVWRRHVQAEARARMGREHAGTDRDHRVVGFADLVGFTALSQQISAHELAEVVDRFEAIAYDSVHAWGGRVVKMIGDEVMFAVPDEAAAVEIALSLSTRYREDDELSDVRVGLAAGPVLVREADLFGPVVNRASRIVNIAFPGTVVCTGEVRDLLVEDPELHWKSIGTRNLKDIGKVPLYAVRRAAEETKPKTSRQEAEARRSERREVRVAELEDRRRERRLRRRSAAGAAPEPDAGSEPGSEPEPHA